MIITCKLQILKGTYSQQILKGTHPKETYSQQILKGTYETQWGLRASRFLRGLRAIKGKGPSTKGATIEWFRVQSKEGMVQVMIIKPRPPFLSFSNFLSILTVFCQKMKNDDIFYFLVKNTKRYNFYLIFPLSRFFHFFVIFPLK